MSLVAKAGQTIHSPPNLFGKVRAGTHLTLQVVGKKPAGKLVLNPNGTFSYTAPAHSHGTVSFKLTARNASGQSKPITITLHVR